MDNIFNIQRFGLLLRRQWLEFGKIYLISLVVALGVIVAFYAGSLWPYLTDQRPFEARYLNFREPLFLIFGFIFISVIASSYFAHLGQKPKAIIELMIPASTFEKFLGGLIFSALLSTASFISLFYLTDLVFVARLNGVDNPAYFFVRNNPSQFWPIYTAPFFVTSIFLLGSIYFEKFHYIKTAITVMIFSGIWTAIIAKSGKLLFEGKIRVNEEDIPWGNHKSNAEWWGFILLAALTIIFWVITYVRLKEKEV
ncbi:MAG: hypothetical protein V4541_06775 [Bacteroidota bacterium]